MELNPINALYHHDNHPCSLALGGRGRNPVKLNLLIKGLWLNKGHSTEFLVIVIEFSRDNVLGLLSSCIMHCVSMGVGKREWRWPVTGSHLSF